MHFLDLVPTFLALWLCGFCCGVAFLLPHAFPHAAKNRFFFALLALFYFLLSISFAVHSNCEAEQLRSQKMKIQIEATDKITDFNGVPVRLWEGWTEHGVKCHVFIHRIAVANSEDASQFERELDEQLPPATPVPLWMIL